MAVTHQWHLKGEYLENCNCEVLCPCVIPGSPQLPTEGHCDMALAFNIDEGDFDGVSLGGLSSMVVMYTPGKMTNADWTTALYIDERATQEQRALLDRILSGEISGPMVRFMALKANFLGDQHVPIAFNGNSQTRSVSIPRILDSM